MRQLRALSLACSLLAAALLPGPRHTPAAAAALESGLGFSDAEPDEGETQCARKIHSSLKDPDQKTDTLKEEDPDVRFCINNSTAEFKRPPSRPVRRSGPEHARKETDPFKSDKAYAGRDLEEQLREAASVDELMTVLYPEYWKMYKCQLRRGGWQQAGEQPDARTRTEDTIKFAAAHYNTEILKSIDYEWRKTQCMPREVCVDVGKEFGAATNTFFKPPCVSVYRCGGCCNSEGHQCMNTSTGFLSKTLFEITVPLSQGPKPITVSFANHTSCRCMSKLDAYRQVHSIIRRALPATLPQCLAANQTCPANYTWNSHACRCFSQQDFIFASSAGDDSADGFHDVCGPNKELDEETCQCVCKGGLRPSSCGPHRELDRDACQCVCKNKLFPASCGPNREFDEATCQCVCKRTCPRNQPLNPAKCACECTENPQKCFLKGKKFQHQTCSCYRRPCASRPRPCEAGLSFSEEVCRCVPAYWKRPHAN